MKSRQNWFYYPKSCPISEGIFDIDAKKQKIGDIGRLMADEGFWKDEQRATAIVRELKGLKAAVEPWESAYAVYEECREFVSVLKPDEEQIIGTLRDNVVDLAVKVDRIEFIALFSGEFDRSNAILSINAGAGGTESCDWVSMLFRMYSRWAEAKSFTVHTIDVLFGEEAGIKNVTVLIEGDCAYGYLKAERGVHRLVRISPFDSNKRRHTSFASVDVIPEIEEAGSVEISEKDLLVETFRASGPGGQHMQKSDTAVRITHVPSGLIAQSQNERSQYQNKQTALKILTARLFALEQQKKEEKLQSQSVEKKKIEWGSQIRSYVMHPYSLVKDHRTDHESGNVAAIMDGKIDDFIEAFLKKHD